MMICGYQNERAINVIRDNFPGVTKPIRLQNKGNRLIKESCNTLFKRNRTFSISNRINQCYNQRKAIYCKIIIILKYAELCANNPTVIPTRTRHSL